MSCERCKTLEYTNPYADSYKCIDCGLEFYSENLPNVCISCNGNVKDW